MQQLSAALWRQVTAPSREEEEATGLVDWLPFLLEDRLKVTEVCAPMNHAPLTAKLCSAVVVTEGRTRISHTQFV